MKTVKTLVLLSLSLILFSNLSSQVFFQESFESEAGWSLSHSFDNGDNKFIKRDSDGNFPGFTFFLFGQDGDMLIGAENTNANETGAPENGIVILSFDDIDISGKTNIECIVSLACNNEDQSYDDRTFAEGDFLDFEVSVDNSIWTNIGSFNAAQGSDGNSGLYHDANTNNNGGEIGEALVNNSFIDYVLPVTMTGNNLQLRARFIMTQSTEEIAFDNVRLRENTEDDVAPTINNVTLLGNQTIKVFFNEAMADNSTNTSFYTGISNLSNVTLANGNLEATLNYSQPLEIGTVYNLVIFGLADDAGNSMSTPYLNSFYYNPTTPDLVITEIMYNDPNQADTIEFIEVYNNDTEVVQMGGIIIVGAVDFTFPNGILNPGEYSLVARKPNAAAAFYSQPFGNYSGSLPNTGGTIILRNTLGQNLDLVGYDNNLPWPPEGDGSGASIALVDYDSENNNGNNWVGSTNGFGFLNGEAIFATPGAGPNSTLPVIQFLQTEYAVNETDGTVEIGLNISASNTTMSSVSLMYDLSSSGSESDVSLSGNESVVFNPSLNGVVNITLPITDDGDLEGFEFLTINLFNPSNTNLGINSSTSILINDDEFVPPTLYINELQSNNQADYSDELGEFDDWFEIYNPNTFAVDLAGYYLTDNATIPLKDRVPFGQASQTTVEPMSWLVFWADESGQEGPRHLNFKLSSQGEYLALKSPDGNTLVDQIVFNVLNIDESYGRETDGNSNWIVFSNTTPNGNNDPNGIEEVYINNFKVSPNPTKSLISWDEFYNVELMDINGQILTTRMRTKSMDLSVYPNGLYLLKFNGEVTFTKKIILHK